MMRSVSQCKNNSEYKITLQFNSLCDSPINDVLIAIAQEVTELLKQSYPVQADEINSIESQ
jgi:hypothetical protein